MDSPTIICIDGTIGSGKSTLIQSLRKYYTCYTEPVEQWTLLGKLYEDPQRYAVPFQYQVMLSQHDQYSMFKHNKGIVVVERCPWTSKNVFVELMDKCGYFKPVTLEAYNELYNILSYNVDHYIYLKIDPKQAMERIRVRDRFAERDIDYGYLEALNEQYNLALTRLNKVHIINASGTPKHVEDDVLSTIRTIT